MKLTCPCCHTIFHLEAALEEAAGREFAAFLAGLGELARPLVAYLGLFRPASRALAYERMLRLAREALELTPDAGRLAAALSETVEALRQKRDEGDVRPLKNHNYLKRVLESGKGTGPVTASEGLSLSSRARSRRAQGITALEEWTRA